MIRCLGGIHRRARAPNAMTNPETPVWQRNLLVLSAGQLVAVAAMGVVIPLIPFFLRDLGMTDRAALERWSGMVFSAPFLAAATMSPIWAFLGDRYGHKKMVVRAVVGLAVVNLLLVFVRTPIQFFLLRLVQGTVTGFVPAALAVTSASTPRERLPDAMGRLAASASAGRLLGPAIGGFLAGFLAFRQLFLLVGGTIAVAAVFVARYLKEPPLERMDASVSLATPFRTAMREPRLRLALPGLLIAMAAISMTMPIFPLYVEPLCGPGTDPKLVTGLGFAVVAAFTLLTSTWLGAIARKVGLKVLLVAALALAALALALHPAARGIGPMLALRALLGVSAAGVGPVLHSMISRAAPEGIRGGITGLANSATILGFFVGPIGGGWLANEVGIGGVFRVAAALALACGVAAALLMQRVGRQRDVAPIPEEIPR
jgi:DHA1 family multidrug resistance protein-like MFS transporter